MLFLLFESGPDRYALDVRDIIEVLPLVHVTPIRQAPAAVAGVLNYRGAPVPVIDLSQLTLGRPAARRLSTRIVLVNYPGAGREPRALGLIAERAIETMQREPSDFVASGVSSERALSLGPVATDARGLLQWIDLRTLLPAPVHDALFRQPTKHTWPLPTSSIC